MSASSTLGMSSEIGWRGWLAVANYRDGVGQMTDSRGINRLRERAS